jgi:hypothetical protein
MEKVKIRVSKVSYVSLVGFIANEFPMKHGNYFGCDGYHMLNMWHENLEHLIDSGVLKESDALEGMAFGGGVVITDSRVPEGYLNKSLCFTGGGGVDNIDELYKFFYKEFSGLDCLCNEKANMVSYSPTMHTMGDYEIKLTRGSCRICKREIYTNNGKEINKEEFDVLHAKLKELFNKK